jgi:branched-subunit amino acid ABC-type transport system permease component
VLTVLLSCIVWGSELAVITLGLSLSFSILGFVSFVHFEFAAVGAYLALWVNQQAHLPLGVAILVAMIVTGLIGVVIDLVVFRAMREADTASKMLASVGLAIVLTQLSQAAFGYTSQFFAYVPTPVSVGGVYVSWTQVIVVGAAVITAAGCAAVMARTSVGRILRSCADDQDLARARGINTSYVITGVWFASAAFAALGGALVGLQSYISPQLGDSVLIPVLAAATVGGLGSARGALLGAFLVATVQNLLLYLNWGWVFGGQWHVAATYKSGLAIALLVVVLLFRPQGLLTRAEVRRG